MIDPFAPFKIKGMEVKNRFVRSATYDGLADDQGRVTDASVALYRDLAQGGVGLITTGHAFVSPQGRSHSGQYGAHSDEMLLGLRRLAATAHASGARIALQMNHAGINSRYYASRGALALAPSTLQESQAPHREMSEEEIEAAIADFGAAALRAREAGIDAVQLHGAHGYLVSQFFSPLSNRRTDRWGGSPKNRRRFPEEVVKEVRRRVGEDYPLLMKFGVMDDRPGGATLEEGLQAARCLVAAGLDALEISAGTGRSTRTAAPGAAEEPYFRERTAAVKRAITVPVIEVGGIRSLAMARAILEAGEADLISLARPLIREPGLIARWQRGDGSPARCISCSRCFWVIEHEGGLGCYRERHPEATD